MRFWTFCRRQPELGGFVIGSAISAVGWVAWTLLGKVGL